MEVADINGANNLLGMGGVASRLSVNAMRPYLDKQGRTCIAVNGKSQLVTNATALLQYDEWKDIDRAVINVATDRLVGVKDLMSRGLVHPLGSIGVTIAMWERASSITGANVDMAGESEGEEDTQVFDTAQVPVPIIHKDFRLNIRRLEASRRMGTSLDVSMPEMAGRVVAEKSEDMLFAGNAIQVDGSTIYGYTNHPNRNTVDMTKQWTDGTKTGAEIVTDVQNMLTAARADRFFGPFQLYIPGTYEGKLDDDYDPDSGDTRTIRQRIMQLSGIAGITVADRLSTHNVLLVQMTRDVVDWAMAQDINTVQWQQKGGMVEQFKVMAIWVPRIKATFDGQSGIVHLYEIP